jgi:hypothetical protein
MAAQDQIISTNYFKKNTPKQIEGRYRLCKEYEETIDHLISGCPTVAKNEYIIRHDKSMYISALLNMQEIRN